MEFWFDILVAAVGLAVIAQYLWSMRAHFHSPVLPDGARVIFAFATLAALAFLGLQWVLRQPTGLQLAGLALQLGSVLLFWWAIGASRRARLRFAFDPDAPHSLVTDGPYRHLRHPFYASYILFWTGWALATASVWAIPPLLALIVTYTVAARGEEKKFERTALAAEYAAYRRRAGLFWPKFSSAKR